MEIISLIGILIGIAVFVALSFNGFNLLFNSLVSSFVVMIFSKMPLLDTLKGTFMGTAAGFIKGYLLLFMLSAVFGKFMENSGAVRRIAISLANLTRKSKNNQKFWSVIILPVFYFILSYVGISGFVLVFSVVAIGRDLFEECDIPWSLYCYGSAGIFPAIILGGSLQPTNIISTEGFGVAPTAGFGLSLVLLIISWIVLGMLIKLDVKKIEKAKEGFLPSGDHIMKLQIASPRKEEDLPNIILAILPLILTIISISVLKLDVLISLMVGILSTVIMMFKYILDKKATITNGVTAAGNPLIYVAAAAGFAAVINASEGFTLVMGVLDGLNPVFAAVGLTLIMSGIAASSSSILPTVLPYAIEKMAEAGISNEIGARLISASVWTYMVPHCPGVVNAVALTKLDYKKAAWIYFKSTCVPGLVATTVAIILIMAKVFI
nr:hypothetical protein [Sedimentibacter sp.]